MLGVRLSLTTDPVLNYVRQYLEKQIQRSLPSEAEFTIGSLKGDLAGDISFSNIVLRHKGSNIATLDSLSTSYSIWDQITGAYRINHITLTRPTINVDKTDKGKLHWLELYEAIADSNVADTTVTEPALELTINQWSLLDGEISINALPNIPIDGLKLPFTMSDLSIEGHQFSYGAQTSGRLDKLEFQLKPDNAEGTWSFNAENAIFEEKLTLEKILLKGTQSFVSSNGWYDTGNQEFEANLSSDTDLASDISPFFTDWPETPPFEASVHLAGKWPEFNIGVEIQGDGLDDLKAQGQFELLKEQLAINTAELNLQGLTPDFTSQWLDTSYTPLSVSRADFTIEDGSVPLNGDLNEFKGQIALSARNIEVSDYRLDSLRNKMEKSDNSLNGNLTLLQLNNGHEGKVQMRLKANRSDTSLPYRWEMNGSLNNLDPAQWASTLPGETRMNGTISGDGQWTNLNDFRANYKIDFSNSIFQDQKFDRLSASGYFNEHNLTSDGQIKLGSGLLSFSTRCEKYQQIPEYQFKVNSRNLNLADLNGLDNFPTDISGEITGYGKYFDPNQMELQADVNLDSSVINNEPIQKLNSQIAIRDTTAIIEEAELLSTIIDGSFTGQMHLQRFYNIDNRINLDLAIKDLQPLAPLVNVTVLEGEGKLKGSLIPEGGEKMELKASLDLNRLNYNDLITVDNISGRIHSMITANPEFLAIMNLENPKINELVLKDFDLTTDGKISNIGQTTQTINGSYNLQFEGTNERSASAKSEGDYLVTDQRFKFHTTALDVKGPEKTLTLQKPFDVTINEDYSWSVDTLNIRSETDQLKAAGTYYNKHKQDIFIDASNLDLEVLQYTFLDKAYVEGKLNTKVNYICRPPYATGQSHINIIDFEFDGIRLDTLKSNVSIQQDHLEGKFNAQSNGKTLASGNISLPFRTGDPTQFPESYFQEKISGEVWLRSDDLAHMQSLFEQWNLKGLNGKGGITMNLSGEVGEPQFEGKMRMTDVLLSGVYLDSLTASMEYLNGKEEIDLGGDIYSLEQHALEWDAQLPFYLDFRDFTVNLPQAQDSIRADLTTRSLNLAIINNFLPPEQVKGIQGFLDGQLSVTGTLEKPNPSGEITLSNGRANIVEGGITLKNIQSKTIIDSTGLHINNLRVENGKGFAEGNGLITLDGLQPGDIQFNMKTRQFPLINTQEYRIVSRYDGEVNGSIYSPSVKGRLDIMSGYAYFNDFGAENIEPVALDTIDNMGGSNISMAIYDSLEMNVDLNFDRRFFVRSQRYIDSELELEGNLDLIKSPGSDLEVFGSIETIGGYLRPLGKTFKHEEGVLRFQGNPENPEIFVRTRFDSKQPDEDVIIWYIAEGTAQDPKFRYESKPEMDLKNIISYTLFGQPFYGLDSWKQSVAKLGGDRSAADMAVEVVLNRIERYATQKLGFDVVQINNSSNSGRTGTSVKTGWYLNEKTFFAIMNEISTRNLQFTLEYMLSDDWQLIMTQGEIQPSGVDVRWQYDY